MSILAAVPRTAAADRRRRCCDRCGLRRQTTDTGRVGNLCADCVLVLRDLGELEAWL